MGNFWLQVSLVVLSLVYSWCVKTVHAIQALHALSILCAVSVVTTLLTALYISTLGHGWNKTFGNVRVGTAARIVLVDLLTDLLNIIPLLLPAMTFALHAVLQRSQTVFAFAVTAWTGQPIPTGDGIAAALTAAGVLMFVHEENTVRDHGGGSVVANEQAQVVLGAVIIAASKLAMETSQWVEMQAVRQGALPEAVVFLTNVAGGPVVMTLLWCGWGVNALEIGSNLTVLPWLLIAGFAQVAYLSCKMHAHKRQVSSLTHAFLSNVRSVVNVCIGKGNPFDWSVWVWASLLCTSMAKTTVR
jgi:hypothetical protein